MTVETDRTYICDLTGEEIGELWEVITIDLKQTETAAVGSGSGERTIHVDREASGVDLAGREPRDFDVTMWVSDERTIPLVVVECGWWTRHIDTSNPGESAGWSDLADRIETAVVRRD